MLGHSTSLNCVLLLIEDRSLVRMETRVLMRAVPLVMLVREVVEEAVGVDGDEVAVVAVGAVVVLAARDSRILRRRDRERKRTRVVGQIITVDSNTRRRWRVAVDCLANTYGGIMFVYIGAMRHKSLGHSIFDIC